MSVSLEVKTVDEKQVPSEDNTVQYRFMQDHDFKYRYHQDAGCGCIPRCNFVCVLIPSDSKKLPTTMCLSEYNSKVFNNDNKSRISSFEVYPNVMQICGICLVSNPIIKLNYREV